MEESVICKKSLHKYVETISSKNPLMEKKILIAIDGSIYSTHSLEYISSLFAHQEEVSFHLLTCVQSASLIPEAADTKNSLLPENLSHQKKLGSTNLRFKKAIQKLNSFGISTDRISSSAISAGTNMGASIQHEAEKLLVDCIVVGRRGLGVVGEMLMGSVSSTLFKRCHSIPIWIIDGKISSKNILVPLDRSIHSLMAVDHLCHIFSGRDDIDFYLFHCRKLFGQSKTVIPEKFTDQLDSDYFQRLENEKEFVLKGPSGLLEKAGIHPNNIVLLPETTELEESHSIIRKASQANCGTIVIGRRGVGMAKGLFGGVSDRTLHKTQNMALWIVG